MQEVPARFVNAHGMVEQLQVDVVELQGVHQESPVRTGMSMVQERWVEVQDETLFHCQVV